MECCGASCLYLHGTIIDFDTIERGSGLCGTGRVPEEDGGNTAALSIWSIGEKSSLDRSDCFPKVVLKSSGKHAISVYFDYI